ncbi:hypothetical protein A8709_03070 [Paenibacillus pectinilyticus]|uniref:Spore coat protein n=1 Tax=Paenibacillus pectinilyticus TaxID=512399 RepID=A0A1C1A787_9BACL|nr:hypothetical protein [Paenibacillus pectinilyticus]OCT16425.1 hypothetical protein A8709_03070 [Paenibacillus pectinilyticus]
MKLVKWLGKIVIGTVLITSITMFTTWYVVNMYVEDIFRQYQLPAMGKKIQFGEFASRLAGELNIVRGKDGGKQTALGNNSSPAPSATPSSNPSGAVSSPSPSPNPNDQQPVNGISSSGGIGTLPSGQDDAIPVMGSARTEESEKKELVMSTEDFAKKKEALSSDDKMKIFSLVVSKLPQDEVQKLSTILEDGITTQELDQVNTTLKKYLSDKEMTQLMDILNKY